MTNILIIDDSRLFRMAHSSILTKAGYRVTCAGDGDEGLRLATEIIPDAILLDMLLPKIDGPEVLRRLKHNQTTSHIPIIVLTGLSEKNEAKLRQEGAFAFLAKGSLIESPNAMLDTLNRALKQSAEPSQNMSIPESSPADSVGTTIRLRH